MRKRRRACHPCRCAEKGFAIDGLKVQSRHGAKLQEGCDSKRAYGGSGEYCTPFGGATSHPTGSGKCRKGFGPTERIRMIPECSFVSVEKSRRRRINLDWLARNPPSVICYAECDCPRAGTVDVSIVASFGAWQFLMGLFLLVGLLGVSLACAALLATWVAFGNSNWLQRGTLAILGGSAVGLVFCFASGELELEWLGLMWVVVTTIALMLLAVRCFGVRLVQPSRSSHDRSKESQFSIRQLMILTAGTAAIAAAVRWLAPLTMTRGAVMVGGGIAICLGVLALVAAWAALRVELNRIRFVVLVITSVAIASVVYSAMEVTGADPGLPWALVVVTYTLVLSTAFLCARSRGIRLL